MLTHKEFFDKARAKGPWFIKSGNYGIIRNNNHLCPIAAVLELPNNNFSRILEAAKDQLPKEVVTKIISAADNTDEELKYRKLLFKELNPREE